MSRLHADDPSKPPADPAPLPSALAAMVSLEPVERLRRRWPRYLAAALTAAMLVGLGRELLGQGLAGLRRAVPSSSAFYLFFLLSYFALPMFEFGIFRRLWSVPASAFLALNRKRVANDVLIGYSGDAYFYAWASARLKMVAAPFGAVKDVSILSALAGNLSGFLLGVVALPLGYQLIAPDVLRIMLWSVGLVVLLTAFFLVFSSRVFSLPRRQLWFVFAMHMLRIAFANITIALAWSYAVPSVSVGMWLFLVAGRQLISRLPLLPNKDLLFANFAILFIGEDQLLSDLMAFTAASILAMHVVVIALLGAEYAVERTRTWRPEGRPDGRPDERVAG
ncbi:hypothetical protein [Sphingomonas adhaesiva]|uniref:hypothetical protein n=1 Tax=Sphingomonas adhaesiva TaxID=28212 RepID=UPI002FF63F62